MGVDATSWANRRGFGRFARNAVGRLVESDAETDYVFYVDAEGEEHAALPSRAQPRRVHLASSPSQAAAAGSHRPLADLFRLTRAVHRDGLDAFLFPSVYTYFPVIGTPTVVGMHDTIVERLPELTVPSWRERTAAGLKHRVAVRRAETQTAEQRRGQKNERHDDVLEIEFLVSRFWFLVSRSRFSFFLLDERLFFVRRNFDSVVFAFVEQFAVNDRERQIIFVLR
mgnify:CR=1 FL=1